MISLNLENIILDTFPRSSGCIIIDGVEVPLVDIEIEIEDNIIRKVKFTSGCHGNLQGISKLVVGMKAQEVIEKLQGIKCGSKQTSCPDQLATCLVQYLQKKSSAVV